MTVSAIYSGEVMHQRLHPRKHRFAYRIDAFLFDLDELESLSQKRRWLSLNRFNLFSFYYRDFGDGENRNPRDYLQDVLRRHGITRPLASARLLCYPRILGFTFNPLAVYYCYDSNQHLFALLYEVSNTFGQRHSYLIPVDQQASAGDIVEQQCDKNFYVSPFMAMEQQYYFRLQVPAQQLSVSIRQSEAGRSMLHAVFRGEQRPLSDPQLLRCFFSLPWMTVKVVLAIHWQAIKLWAKGMRPVSRPAPPDKAISFEHQRH